MTEQDASEQSSPDQADGSGSPSAPGGDRTHVAPGHMACGWSFLAVFVTLGIVLEGLLGLKVGFYLDSSNETRRLMWTLAHAHGALFGLLHIAFALSLPGLDGLTERRTSIASRCLYAGTVAMPLGFFLGGLFAYDGDPGLGVVLSPIGAALVLVAVVTTAVSTRRG